MAKKIKESQILNKKIFLFNKFSYFRFTKEKTKIIFTESKKCYFDYFKDY